MRLILILLIIFVALIGLVFLESYRELNRIKLTRYEIKGPAALTGKRFIFISDYHEAMNGRLNSRIIKLIDDFEPEYILLGGDMVNSNAEGEDGETVPAAELINTLAEKYKVLYSYGNHEKRCTVNYKGSGKAWEVIRGSLDTRVRFLINENYELWDAVRVYGLDIPLKYYSRGSFPELGNEEITRLLGERRPDEYTILLAHTPDFMKGYSEWGADLVLSGHFHGGILRFPIINRGLVTPRLRPFADYVYGIKKMGSTTMIITNGIGQHSIKLKINNIPEVVGVVFK